MGTRIRWAFHATDHSKIGTVEEVPTDDVPWLIQCGNAVLADHEPTVPAAVEPAPEPEAAAKETTEPPAADLPAELPQRAKRT